MDNLKCIGKETGRLSIGGEEQIHVDKSTTMEALMYEDQSL